MPREKCCEGLAEDWEAFLEERGHTVSSANGVDRVLRSRDPDGTRYRWLVFVAEGRSKTLASADLEDVRRHQRRARGAREKAYAVIGFQKPVRKVIVMPTDRILKRKRILPRKGGIPWGD